MKEIITDLTKDQALEMMRQGRKVAHNYYAPDEFIYMRGNRIYTEDGCDCGYPGDEFWAEIQKWPTGWKVVE